MCCDYAVQPCGLLHRLQHHLAVLDSAAVVRERHAAVLERGEVHELAALAPLRDGGVGQHLHHGVAADDLQFLFEVLRAVGHGVEVGHRADGGETSAGSRTGACEYRLLV